MVASFQQLKLIGFFPSFTIFLPITLFLFYFCKRLIVLIITSSKNAYAPKKNLNLPPSPPKLPILGNLHQFGTRPHQSLGPLSQRYGELMLMHLGPKPYLIVSSVEAVAEILKTHNLTFSSRPITKTPYKLFYSGKDVILAPDGEYWRRMKSICVQHLLSNTRVRSFRSLREEEVALLMEKIQSSASSPLNLTDLFGTLTKDVICRTAFGRKYQGTDFQKMLKDLSKLLSGFRVGDYISWLAWTYKLDGWDAKVERVAKEFDKFLEEVIKQHQESHKGEQDEKLIKDLVDVLLDIQKDKTVGFTIGRDSIKALMMDMFGAGMDTTFIVLEWAMSELLRHPAIMEELQKEVREIVGRKSHVDEDDLKQMKYLNAVIKETLRLHPPVPFMVRQSSKDVKLKGYDIQEGTAVLINIYAIQRNPDLWEEPEKFNPERFLNSSRNILGEHFEFTPFGAGRRICPGISFATSISELLLANVMYKFNWSLPNGAKGDTLDMSEALGVTTHRKTPLFGIATIANIM